MLKSRGFGFLLFFGVFLPCSAFTKGSVGMISGGIAALARVFKHSFDVHLIFAAETFNLSELATKALPRAVQEFID